MGRKLFLPEGKNFVLKVEEWLQEYDVKKRARENKYWVAQRKAHHNFAKNKAHSFSILLIIINNIHLLALYYLAAAVFTPQYHLLHLYCHRQLR